MSMYVYVHMYNVIEYLYLHIIMYHIWELTDYERVHLGEVQAKRPEHSMVRHAKTLMPAQT